MQKTKKKSRLYYICGQILEEHNSFKQAAKHYEKSLKGSVDYEMTFNSKMNIARFSERSGKEADKTEEKLLKMTRDDKNKDYLDQIYFTLAEIEIAKEDTIKAVKYYTLSTKNSIDNYSQKTLSFLSLAEIKFNQGRYLLAKNSYDSVVYYIEEDHKKYIEITHTHSTLEDLATHLTAIVFEDSVQQLSTLSENELQIL